jgi:hypothetical protein
VSNGGKDIVLLARHMPSEPNSTLSALSQSDGGLRAVDGASGSRQGPGFNSPQAFDRALQQSHLPLRLSRIEGRRGVFALSDDVADYLTQALEKGV